MGGANLSRACSLTGAASGAAAAGGSSPEAPQQITVHTLMYIRSEPIALGGAITLCWAANGACCIHVIFGIYLLVALVFVHFCYLLACRYVGRREDGACYGGSIISIQ